MIIINICSTCIYGPSPHFSIFTTPQYTALRHRCHIKNQELLILRECLGSSPVRPRFIPSECLGSSPVSEA